MVATTRTITGNILITVSPASVELMLADPASGVIRDLFVRGERVRQEAIRIAPRKTGNLANHIVKRLVQTKGGRPTMLVGVENVRYALWVHEGTRPHPIDAKNAPFLVFTGRDGGLVFTKHVDHPGTKPNRFLVRALPAAAG